jgi:predicted phage tail component-like protein
MLSFTFAGKNSFTDFGIIIAKRPNLPSPKRRVAYIEVPGRDSNLRYDEGTYEDITLSVECTIKGDNLMERLDSIKAWLYSACEGDLIFSFQTDKKYRAQVVNSIDIKQAYKICSSFVVVWNCRPFKYQISSQQITVNTGAGITIVNPGSIAARPMIKAYCVGNGRFKINSAEVALTGLTSQFITLDSELEEAYFTENGVTKNGNNLIAGEFPLLSIGNNTITFSGNITKLEITPNWRWL